MNKTEAHALLDAARSGADISRGAITEALRVTGDLLVWRPRPAESSMPEGWNPEPREQRRVRFKLRRYQRALEAA
jgi:hypothetical protein